MVDKRRLDAQWRAIYIPCAESPRLFVFLVFTHVVKVRLDAHWRAIYIPCAESPRLFVFLVFTHVFKVVCAVCQHHQVNQQNHVWWQDVSSAHHD
jgi:hypothetical protein